MASPRAEDLRPTPRGGRSVEVLRLSADNLRPIPLTRQSIEDLRLEGDPAVAQIATIQHGAIATWQLNAVGLSGDMITTRKRHGGLHTVYKGVHLVGHLARGPLTLPTAGLLAAGSGGTLSFHTAGALQANLHSIDGIVDVTLPRPRPSRKGLRFHTGTLQPDELHSFNALAITSPARTAVDLATVLPSRRVPALLDHFLIHTKATRDGILAAAARGRRNVELIRQALAVPDDIEHARSLAETKLTALVRKAGLPNPARNDKVAGHLCDLVWHQHRLVAEYDSWRYHHTPARFAADRARNNDVQSVGYRIFRFTEHDLDHQPEVLIARLAVELARAGTSAAPAS